MASPQKENGYTAIANELMEAFIKYPIPATQMQCLLLILRKTYGYSKKTDAISLSQFENFTKLDRRHIYRAIKELQKKNIIKVIKRSAKDGTKKCSEYRLNKIYTSWVFVPKKARGSAIKGTKGSAIKGTHINNIKTSKEIYKEKRLGLFENKVSIPKEYSIQPEHIKYAESKNLTPEQAKDQFEGFKVHHEANGSKFKSWYAAYQKWIRNGISYGQVIPLPVSKIKTMEDRKAEDEEFFANRKM